MNKNINLYNELIDINSPIELINFMTSNIKYGFVTYKGKIYEPDNPNWHNAWLNECIVQTGTELLNSCYGTCWDQVELERFWFDKNGYFYKTIFLIFEKNEVNNLPTHTFLVFKKEEKWVWFENAFEDQKGIHEFDSLEKLLDDVKTKHFNYAYTHCNAKKEDKSFLKHYEYLKPKSGLTVNEYLCHVMGE